jgi:mono/diheme cytochrome c family protein
MSLERLNTGRELYAEKCSSCHALKAPGALPPDAWASEVADMRAKKGTRLTNDEAELIVAYLTTASRRGQSPEARNAGRAPSEN